MQDAYAGGRGSRLSLRRVAFAILLHSVVCMVSTVNAAADDGRNEECQSSEVRQPRPVAGSGAHPGQGSVCERYGREAQERAISRGAQREEKMSERTAEERSRS